MAWQCAHRAHCCNPLVGRKGQVAGLRCPGLPLFWCECVLVPLGAKASERSERRQRLTGSPWKTRTRSRDTRRPCSRMMSFKSSSKDGAIRDESLMEQSGREVVRRCATEVLEPSSGSGSLFPGSFPGKAHADVTRAPHASRVSSDDVPTRSRLVRSVSARFV